MSKREEKEEQIALAVALYVDGLTGPQAAEVSGLSVATVYTHVNSLGLGRGKQGRQRTYSHEEIIALRKSGKLLKEIQEITGCSYTTLQYICKKNGLTVKRKAKLVYEEVAAAIKSGMTDCKIAETFGVDRGTVKRFRVANGLERKKKQ